MTDRDPTTSHPGFAQPENPDGKVWRYVDLGKLVDLFRTKSLWYCQAARLGDPFECTLTEPMYQQVQKKHEERRRTHGEQVVAEQFGFSVHSRTSMYVNCWCMLDQRGGDTESNALWRIYCVAGGGVAIVTTYRRLAELIPKEDNIGLVQYIDFDHERFDWGSLFAYVMHKRKVYEYEQEVRVVRYLRPPLTPQFFITNQQWKQQSALSALQSVFSLDEIDVDWLATHHPPGFHVPIDVNRLVEAIVVSPSAPEWYLDCVRALAEAFGFEIPVRWSAMRSTPRHHVEKRFGPRPGELLVAERKQDEPARPDTHRSLHVKSWEPPPGPGLVIGSDEGMTHYLRDADHAIHFAKQPDQPDSDRPVQELLRYLMRRDEKLERLGDAVGKTFDVVRRSSRQ